MTVREVTVTVMTGIIVAVMVVTVKGVTVTVVTVNEVTKVGTDDVNFSLLYTIVLVLSYRLYRRNANHCTGHCIVLHCTGKCTLLYCNVLYCALYRRTGCTARLGPVALKDPTLNWVRRRYLP